MNGRKIVSVIKQLLIYWGVLLLIGAVGIGGFVVYEIWPGNRNNSNTASPRDVRFVLNWCKLGEGRIDKVVHSYVSARSFTGDHLDAHVIKITYVKLEELTAKPDADRSGWYRGDQLPQVLNDAVGFVGPWLNAGEIPWFPDKEELRSNQIFAYPLSIYYNGLWPTEVELIFIRPSDNMVFYFSAKT